MANEQLKNKLFISGTDIIDAIPQQINTDWNATSGVSQILNKPNLATVATSGNYNDLTNKPSIPTTTKFRTWVTLGATGTATYDMIICVKNADSTISVTIDGVERCYMMRRDKYGVGNISMTFPIAKGSSWNISGATSYIYGLRIY